MTLLIDFQTRLHLCHLSALFWQLLLLLSFFEEMYVLDHAPTSLSKAPIFLRVATASHLVFELPLLEKEGCRVAFF